jgi:O-antigen/teichoic acid export membrane protein
MVSGVNFLTGILLARYLGLKEFGVFTLVWMAVLFVNGLQFAMICSPMMSIGPKQAADEAPAYYGAVLSQQVAFAALSFVVLYIGVKASGIFFPQWQVQHLALPLASVALAFQMQDFMRRYFFTRNRASAAIVNDAIRYLGQLGILVWLFIVMELDGAGVLWIIAGTSAVATAAGIFSLERMAWDRGMLATVTKRHWHFSKWLTGSALMQWTSGNLFIVAAGGVLGAVAVGALKAAQNVMGITHILFQGLENIVPVRAGTYYHKGGSQALVVYLRKVAWAGGLATAAMALLAAAFPEFWLGLFYGWR